MTTMVMMMMLSAHTHSLSLPNNDNLDLTGISAPLRGVQVSHGAAAATAPKNRYTTCLLGKIVLNPVPSAEIRRGF